MDWHIVQSRHNCNSNKYLAQENPHYRDWEITTLFYSAVHIVDNYFLLLKKPEPDNHTKRRRLIDLELQDISREYSLLECLSQRARYESTPQTLSHGYVKLAEQLHTTIATYVNSQLYKFGMDPIK